MIQLIRKLTEIYENESYQAMKMAFEEYWQTSSDWSKVERFSVGIFAVRLMVKNEDIETARVYLTELKDEGLNENYYSDSISKYDGILKTKEAETLSLMRPVEDCYYIRKEWRDSEGHGWCTGLHGGGYCPYTVSTVEKCLEYSPYSNGY